MKISKDTFLIFQVIFLRELLGRDRPVVKTPHSSRGSNPGHCRHLYHTYYKSKGLRLILDNDKNEIYFQ